MPEDQESARIRYALRLAVSVAFGAATAFREGARWTDTREMERIVSVASAFADTLLEVLGPIP